MKDFRAAILGQLKGPGLLPQPWSKQTGGEEEEQGRVVQRSLLSPCSLQPFPAWVIFFQAK